MTAEALAALWVLAGVVALSMRDLDSRHAPGHYMYVMTDWLIILLGPVGILAALLRRR